MNEERRSRISKIIPRLVEIHKEVKQLEKEETSAFESLPKGLRDTKQGIKSEGATCDLFNSAAKIEESIRDLTDAVKS
ncbi:hypothetical protein ACQU0X_25925 [Pseudovibrio ascidiaceicola]|uniref:hypothetical protein n=1 Tax=Pseudovibrio ascidiaceicola TaxID=285279 RepID=UPI003D36BA05